MNILAIDTSGPQAFVSLKLSSDVVHSAQTDSANSHNENLGKLVVQVLGKGGISVSDLSRIVLGAGPGSFTGLRIGYGFAQGLAASYAVAIETISSLWAYAATDPDHQLIAAISDARRDEVFFGLYERTKVGKLVQKGPEEIVPAVAIEQRLRDASQALEIPRERAGIMGFAAHTGCLQPSRVAEGLLALSEQKGAKIGYSVAQISALAPNYLRAVSARTIADRGQLDVNRVVR